MSDLENRRYTEISAELRRFRDYQLTATTWYTSINTAIILAVLTGKSGKFGESFKSYLNTKWGIKFFIGLIVFNVMVACIYTVCYTDTKYKNLRDLAVKDYGDDWRKLSINKEAIIEKLQPHDLIVLLQVILFISALVIIIY